MKVLENNPGALNRNNITPKSALISDINNERRIYDKSEIPVFLVSEIRPILKFPMEN